MHIYREECTINDEDILVERVGLYTPVAIVIGEFWSIDEMRKGKLGRQRGDVQKKTTVPANVCGCRRAKRESEALLGGESARGFDR